MGKDCRFCAIQNKINKDVKTVPSHKIIDMYLDCNETDYRYEVKPNEIKELRDRKCDNVSVGRC